MKYTHQIIIPCKTPDVLESMLMSVAAGDKINPKDLLVHEKDVKNVLITNGEVPMRACHGECSQYNNMLFITHTYYIVIRSAVTI